MSFNLYEDNYILADDASKKYKFYFGINGERESNTNEIETNLFMKNGQNIYLTNNKNKTQYSYEAIIDIYYDKSTENNIYKFQTLSDVYLKTYLISNQYYKNIVSGLTEITSETKAIAFKVRKDIFFDFFVMKLYSDDPTKNIYCSYELKIVESKYIEKGKVMVGFNEIEKFQKNNIFLKFSNPYNKFDSRIKNEDYVFLLISFNNTNEDYYPVYTDIRYYYNDQIINIEESKPKILLSQKEYQIFGDSNNHEKNKILLNINKCNITKDYYIKSYYEDFNNIIAEDKISGIRNILFHDNLYNNTKFLLYSNINTKENVTDNNNIKNSLLQASYYQNGDLYMNYFSINESLFKSIKITQDYKISYKDDLTTITLSWNDFITNKNIIKNLNVNYSLYILPQNSPINTICQMTLVPPNVSIINKNKYEPKLPKGQYKVGIFVSVINDEFPMTTFYDFSSIDVPQRINIRLIIIIAVAIVLIIAIILFIIWKKKRNKDILNKISKSGMISMASIFDREDSEDKLLTSKDNPDEDNDNKKEIKNNDGSINNNDDIPSHN
jgi:hypothetical protein